MNDLNDVRDVSHVLDGGVGRLEPRFAGQQRVHAALLSTTPHEIPSIDIRVRVMARLGPRKPADTASVWPLALAASLTMAVGLAWMTVHSLRPAPAISPMAQMRADATRTFSLLLDSPRQFDRAIAASVDAQMKSEARMIREDTQQGMEMVLSRLPLGSAKPVR